MSLIRTAQLNGHDPYVYLKDEFGVKPCATSASRAPV
ncbi:transposase domain-containing protein [Paraburkholderia sp. SIMBA_054]